MGKSMEQQRQMFNRLQDPAANATGTSFAPGMSFNAYSGTVTISLKNTGETAKQIAICPAAYNMASLIKDENGNAVDVILADTIQGFEVNCTPRTVATTLSQLKFSPTALLSMKVSVDANAIEQLDERIYYRKESAFKNLSDDRIVPSDYKTENQQLGNVVTINDVKERGWIFGAKSLILYRIGAGRRVQLTLNFGGGFDPTDAVIAASRMFDK